MLEAAARAKQAGQRAQAFDVAITGVATAVPPHKVSQDDIAERARAVFPHLARLDGLYANTGIESRYACQPKDWYYERHGWEARTEVFQRHALQLLEEVTLAAIADAGISLKDIDALVVNTITGLAIPSLDAMLMNRLDFPRKMERLPIFGLGCGGGVAGLSRAARYAQAMPGSNVLFLTVDLCSLCLRIADPSLAMFVSAALFGDGAAGVVLSNVRGTAEGAGAGRVLAVGDHFWSSTEHIMGWDIKEDGFGVVLSPELPGLIRNHLGRCGTGLSRCERHEPRRVLRIPVASGRRQDPQHGAGGAWARGRGPCSVARGAARLRQHVVADRSICASPRAEGGRRRPASLDGIRSGLLGLFRGHRSLTSLRMILSESRYRLFRIMR